MAKNNRTPQTGPKFNPKLHFDGFGHSFVKDTNGEVILPEDIEWSEDELDANVEAENKPATHKPATKRAATKRAATK